MKGEQEEGKKLIIQRNLTMSLIANMDTWIPIIIGFAFLYALIGEYFGLTWTLILLFFQFGYLFNATRKYGDKHYSIIIQGLLVSAYIHLYMFLHQFKLPKELSWDKTPMLFERQEDEVKALSSK